MKTNNSIIKSIARLVSVVLLMAVGVGQMWGAAVASKAPADGKQFIIALYYDSKYYALPHIGSTGGLFCGEECTLNGSNQVTAIAGETSAEDCLWLLTSTGTENEYYITYDNAGTKAFLYKNGTTGESNYKIQTTSSDDKAKCKWVFTSGTANSVTTYSVKTTKSGATKNTVLRGDVLDLGNDETCYGFNVDGTDNSYEITLLEIVPRTVTFNAQGGSFDDPSVFVNTNQITEATGGSGITLPLANPNAGCVSEGWAFYGWATARCASSTTTAPAIVGQAGDIYYLSGNSTTLHAVYAKGEYTKITSTDDLNTTDKYFFAAVYSDKNYIMTDYWEANKLAAKQIDETSTGKYHAGRIIPSWCYTLEEGSSSWYIVDCNSANTNHYIDSYYSSWYGRTKDDAFTFTYSTDHWIVQNVYTSGSRYFGYSSGDNTFNRGNSETELLIYKVTTTPYYYSNPSCCEYEVSISESGSSHLAAVNGMTFSSSSIATCGDAASRTITITVTPASGYSLLSPTKPEFTKTSGTVANPTITGPTDNGNGTYSYECTFASNNNGAGTFAITPGQFINYRTQCCTKLGDIDGTVTLTQGGNSVTISGWSTVSNASSYTVKMYKKNGGGTWDLVSGSTSGGSAGAQGTRTGILEASKSVTYTGLVVESEYKFSITAIGNGSTYCDGDETDVDEINSTDVSSTPFKFRYSIYIDNGSNSGWGHHYIEPTGNTDEGSVDITLAGPINYYQFIVKGTLTGNWGQTGTSNIPADTKWTLNGGSNVRLQTWIGGTYTFTVDYSGTTNPGVTVTFPPANQAAGKIVYWDASVVANWDHLHFRVGTDASANAGSDCKTNGQKVPGTDNFYKVTTAAFNDMRVWAIANNTGWTGSNTNGVYKTNTGDSYAVTLSSEYQDYVVGNDGVTLVPYGSGTMGTYSHDNNCRFYTVTKTDGMLTHNVSLNSPDHGTLLVTYTNTSGTTGQTVTEGNNADLAHRCILTITATPDDGYEVSSLTVNSVGFTSGNTHILSADAVVEASFTAQTSTVTLDNNSATSGSQQTVTATYDAAMPLVTTADGTPAVAALSRTGYTFNGWWDNTSGGNQYYTYNSGTGVIASARTWDKTGAQTLKAQWTVNQYTLTWDLQGGTVSTAGTGAAAAATGTPSSSQDYGTDLTAPVVTKNGYTFNAWSPSVAGTMPAANTTYTASWNLATYTVTLNPNGGTINAGNITSYTYLTGATLPTNVTRDGYRFDGWFSDDGVWSDQVTAISTTATGDKTYYAKWTQIYTVTWHVNGSTYNTGVVDGNSHVVSGGKISACPTAPADNTLNNCASKFMGWSSHSWGSTPKGTGTGEYDDLFTDVAGSPTISANTDFYAVFAEGGGAAINTVMWSENWDGATTSNGSTGMDDAKPSANSSTGKVVYGGATVTYTEASNGTYVRNDNNAGGSKPELLLKGNDWWKIEGIPTGGAATLTLEYRIAGGSTVNVSTTTDKVTVGSVSGSSNPYSHTITIGSGVTSFDLKFTQTGNRRLDNISVKVATVTYSNYVTECAANQVRVTYDFNGGSGTACSQGVTTKTASYTVCSTTPTKNYYDFGGWNDGTSTYAAGATGYNLQATTTFTAQWSPTTYNITYELDGGTNNVGNPATYNVTTATITLQDPTKGHDRFEGWFKTYSAGVYSDQVTSIPLGSHGDITLYAKWTERHEIVFDADGTKTTIYRADDENMEDAVAGQGSVPSDPDAPSACDSKVFVGWSESEIDGETDTEPVDLMKPAAGTVDEDKHFYAVWANESSESGTVTVFSDDLSVDGDSDDPVSSRSGWTALSSVYTNNGDGVRVSAKSSAGSMTIDLSGKSLESTITLSMQVKRYGTDDSYLGLSCMDEGTTASFSPTSFTTTSSSWEDKSCTITNVNAATQSITLSGSTSSKRIYIRKVKVTQTGTVYTYSAYSTSCCATKVNLTHNSPEHGTITFGKTKIGTCDEDKEVSLTITPAAGYQLTGWTVNTASGYADAKSTSPAVVINNNSNVAQNITLTFAEDANKDYDVTATFGEMVVTGWNWTMHEGGSAIPSRVDIYVGQSVRFDVAYIPSGVLSSHKVYVRTKDDKYINWPAGAQPSGYSTIVGKASTGDNTTDVVYTNSEGSLTETVKVKVLPLPKVHFVDNVHNESFSDVVATIEDNALSATKSTPTHEDFDGSTANTCEEQHLHLVGWIDGDWDKYQAYMEGGTKPTESEIIGATGYFYAPGADIDVSAKDGKTYYAVWAKVE